MMRGKLHQCRGVEERSEFSATMPLQCDIRFMGDSSSKVNTKRTEGDALPSRCVQRQAGAILRAEGRSFWPGGEEQA